MSTILKLLKENKLRSPRDVITETYLGFVALSDRMSKDENAPDRVTIEVRYPSIIPFAHHNKNTLPFNTRLLKVIVNNEVTIVWETSKPTGKPDDTAMMLGPAVVKSRFINEPGEDTNASEYYERLREILDKGLNLHFFKWFNYIETTNVNRGLAEALYGINEFFGHLHRELAFNEYNVVPNRKQLKGFSIYVGNKLFEPFADYDDIEFDTVLDTLKPYLHTGKKAYKATVKDFEGICLTPEKMSDILDEMKIERQKGKAQLILEMDKIRAKSRNPATTDMVIRYSSIGLPMVPGLEDDKNEK